MWFKKYTAFTVYLFRVAVVIRVANCFSLDWFMAL